MDFFDKIAEELKSMRAEINKYGDFSFKRDFDDLSYNAKKMYNNRYSKKIESANVLHKLHCFFEVFFDKKMSLSNSLPISIPDIGYPSDEKKEEVEIKFNATVLLEASFNALNWSGLIRHEIKEEEKNKKKGEILNGFLEDLKNNEFKIEIKMISDYFDNMYRIK